MRQRTCNCASQIKQQKPEMPHRIFDIVTKHPNKEHVSGKMHEVAMEKGIGYIGEYLIDLVKLRGQRLISVHDRRYEAKAVIGSLNGIRTKKGRRTHDQPDKAVKGNKAEGYVLKPDMRERIAIADVPQSFQGAAIGMITAGLMSLAFMGFAGLIKL